MKMRFIGECSKLIEAYLELALCFFEADYVLIFWCFISFEYKYVVVYIYIEYASQSASLCATLCE